MGKEHEGMLTALQSRDSHTTGRIQTTKSKEGGHLHKHGNKTISLEK